jgi:mono/diheme cytochrome c family protein
MLKQILGEWKPKWNEGAWRATLIVLPIVLLSVPLIFLALPYLDILNDMAVQAKAKPQGEYGWFSDEQIPSERAPVTGTIPQGYHPYHVTEKDEEKAAKHAGATLVNPVPRTDAVLKQGQAIFGRICITCHGPRGESNGRIQGPDLFPAPPSLHSAQAKSYADGRIWHVITRGWSKMPSYANVLTPEERWSVVHFVRALQLAKTMAEKKAEANK